MLAHSKLYRAVLMVAAMLCAIASEAAAVTPQDYRDSGVNLPAGAAVPLDATVTDDGGHRRTLGELLAHRPSVLVFADYTCTTLCGPIVAFMASALDRSGLPPDGFRLVIVGLDPKDGAAEAAKMRTTHLGPIGALNKASAFVTADQASVDRLTAALGYRYSYDEAHDQFIHPAAAFVLAADGRVSRVLTGLGISPGDVRLALVEAGEGRIGTFGDQVRLLCSGFDPDHGLYNLMISRILMISGGATALVLGGGIGLLALAHRRRTA